MDNKYDEQFTIIQETIEPYKQEMKANKQDPDKKMSYLTEDFKAMIA